MRIIFLCGSLEIGSDGVGDYTRRLAGELLRNGHDVMAIALNDKYVVKEVEEIQIIDNINISVLRLSSSLMDIDRYHYVEQKIKIFNPEWLSLQFVPFAFHLKGLCFKLGKQLQTIGKNRQWHIMFHELWVGMDYRSSLKLITWGSAQKWMIRGLIRDLKPKVIHTQTKLYQMQLHKLGFNAKYLSLFSNIPVNKEFDFNILNERWFLHDKSICFLLFGGIHPGAPVKQFVKEVAIYAKKEKIQVVLKMIGRSGVEQEHWATEWKSAGLPVEILGEQPADIISLTLENADIGISTTPIALAEKSGTIAAMREHGLPVICVRDFWKAKGIETVPEPSGVFEYKVGNFQECLKKSKKNVGGTTVAHVAQTFTSNLFEIEEAKIF